MNLQAQVRIGKDLPPVNGALLDLNAKEVPGGYVGGLLLPNVNITDLGRIPDTFTDAGQIPDRYNAPQLAGLMVYDLHSTCDHSIEVIKRADGTVEFYIRTPGIRVWDGTWWQYLGKRHKPVVWMSYNLGASSITNYVGANGTYDLTTPKGQMKYLAVELGTLTTAKALDSTVYGGWWQWGRRTDGHQERVASANNFPTAGTTSESGAQHINWASGVYDHATGQIKEGINSGNGSPAYGKFIKTNTTPYDWIAPEYATAGFTSTLGMYPARWGNGVATTTSTAPNGNPYNGDYYQEPVKTVNDPCPEGWRVPTQDEWETLGAYCKADQAGGSFSVTGGVGNPGVNNPDLYWVAVIGGLVNATWSTNSTASGYAIYTKVDWLGADGLGTTTGAKAYLEASSSNRLYDPDDNLCPSPLLFLPVAGYRYYGDGNVYEAGRTGSYWSSTVSGTDSHYYLYLNSEAVGPDGQSRRASGVSVRCVAEFL
jgi:hypothetical protein